MRLLAILALVSSASAAAIPTQSRPEKCGNMYTELPVRGDVGIPMYSTGRCDNLLDPIMTIVNEKCGLCVFFA
jgi:hypothetical protein